MLLSKYIEGLQKFLEENGDMDAYYASDDEGNSYQQVNYAGSKLFRYKDASEYRPDLLSEEDIEEYDYVPDHCTPVCVVN
jgi:hypothetical protein